MEKRERRGHGNQEVWDIQIVPSRGKKPVVIIRELGSRSLHLGPGKRGRFGVTRVSCSSFQGRGGKRIKKQRTGMEEN